MDEIGVPKTLKINQIDKLQYIFQIHKLYFKVELKFGKTTCSGYLQSLYLCTNQADLTDRKIYGIVRYST